MKRYRDEPMLLHLSCIALQIEINITGLEILHWKAWTAIRWVQVAHVQRNLSYDKAHQHLKRSSPRTDLRPQSHLRPSDPEMAFFPLEDNALKAFFFKYILSLTEGSKHTVGLYKRQSRNCSQVYSVVVPTCPENIGSLGQHLLPSLCQWVSSAWLHTQGGSSHHYMYWAELAGFQ